MTQPTDSAGVCAHSPGNYTSREWCTRLTIVVSSVSRFGLLHELVRAADTTRPDATRQFCRVGRCELAITYINLYSPKKTVVTQKLQNRKHVYKQSENNDQVHHSSWQLVLEYKQNIIYNHRSFLNCVLQLVTKLVKTIHRGNVL